MGIIAGVLSMFFWGSALFLAALAARKIGNVLALFWMQVFGFLTGSIYFLINVNSFSFKEVPGQIPILIAIAALQVIANLGFYKGAEKAQISLVTPISAAWGLIVAILSVIFLGEILEINQIFAIILIVAGIILLSINVQELLKLKKVNLLVGVKEGVIAMLGWGVSLFLLVYPSKDLDWFLPAYTFRFFVLIILSAYILSSIKTFKPKSKKFPLALLLAIGVFDMAGFLSYSYGVSTEHASIVAPIGSAFAVVTVLLAQIFLKEKMKLGQIVGIIGVVLGLILISI